MSVETVTDMAAFEGALDEKFCHVHLGTGRGSLCGCETTYGPSHMGAYETERAAGAAPELPGLPDAREAGAMTEYPILVERWDEKHPANLAVCTKCGYERTWDPAEGDPYDLCIKHEGNAEGGCRGQIVMKYDCGSKCRSCGKLDYWFPSTLQGCCSRACMLQVEYAESLKERAS
jgi:hypothetical protein